MMESPRPRCRASGLLAFFCRSCYHFNKKWRNGYEQIFRPCKGWGILLFYLAQIGFIPGVIAYLAEKASLKNGTPPTRCRSFLLIAALLFLGSTVWMILDFDNGAWVWLLASLPEAALLGIVLGIKASQSDFRRQNKDK